MKPVQIDCGNGCKACDGYGVMTLFCGPNHSMLAPCLNCSPTKSLAECLARREQAESQLALAEEKRLIDEHNARVSWSASDAPEKLGPKE